MKDLKIKQQDASNGERCLCFPMRQLNIISRNLEMTSKIITSANPTRLFVLNKDPMKTQDSSP
jgi:hypothetical protein